MTALTLASFARGVVGALVRSEVAEDVLMGKDEPTIGSAAKGPEGGATRRLALHRPPSSKLRP
jgi:hypothetical protein